MFIQGLSCFRALNKTVDKLWARSYRGRVERASALVWPACEGERKASACAPCTAWLGIRQLLKNHVVPPSRGFRQERRVNSWNSERGTGSQGGNLGAWTCLDSPCPGCKRFCLDFPNKSYFLPQEASLGAR